MPRRSSPPASSSPAASGTTSATPSGRARGKATKQDDVIRLPARPKPEPAAESAAQETDLGHVNEVRLVGRLTGEPVLRQLPSGDTLLSFRLVVARGPVRPRRGSGRIPTVDTLDCAAWRRDVQRVVIRAKPGELLEVRGALRRRFWRAPAGPASRSEVEAVQVSRVGPA